MTAVLLAMLAAALLRGAWLRLKLYRSEGAVQALQAALEEAEEDLERLRAGADDQKKTNKA